MNKHKTNVKLKVITQTPETSDKPTSKLGQNLAVLMKAGNVTFEQLSANTNISIPTLKRFKLEDNTNPTIASLLPLSTFFKVTIGQLIGTEELPPYNLLGDFSPQRQHWRKVPIINWESLNYLQDPDKKIIHLKTIHIDINVSSKTFGVIINEAKWPGVLDNTVLIIDPEKEITDRCIAIFTGPGFKEAVLKEVIYHGKSIYLKPMDPQFKSELLDESFQLIGVVVQTRYDFNND